MVVCHGLMECSWLLLAWPRVVCVVAVQNEGLTALHRAAGSGHADAVKALLAAGADVTRRVYVATWPVLVQALEMLVCLLPVSGEVSWSHGV